MNPARIAVVGSLNMDVVADAAVLPTAGETVMGHRLRHVPGGKGANQAVAAARLGSDVAMIGRVGGDDFGRRLLGQLRDDGVDVEHVTATPETSSGVAVIVVAGGHNQIVVIPGANGLLTSADVVAAEELIASAEVLLLQFEVPIDTVRTAAAIGRRHGVMVVLNPAPAMTIDADLLTHVDVIAPNETEAALLTGVPIGAPSDALVAAERLAAMGPRTVVVTLGERGVAVHGDGRSARLEEPFAVEVAVDSTAAGDAFIGALATALGEGEPFASAIQWGMAAGALAVTRAGAQPSLPRREEVVHTIASGRTNLGVTES